MSFEVPESGPGLFFTGKTSHKGTEGQVVFVDKHSVDELFFIFGNLNHTVNFFFLCLIFVFGSDPVVKINDGSP